MTNKTKLDELGEKKIPKKMEVTAQAAVQFAGKGVDSLRSIEFHLDHNKNVITLPQSEILGRLCVGNLLFAQGLELIFKLIFMAEGIKDTGFNQHDLVNRFEAIRQLRPLKVNLETWMPAQHKNKMNAAIKVVREAENSFMISRYIGLKKGDLRSISSIDAAGLLLALTLSYQGLQQFEAARLIGITIKNPDGTLTVKPSTPFKAQIVSPPRA